MPVWPTWCSRSISPRPRPRARRRPRRRAGWPARAAGRTRRRSEMPAPPETITAASLSLTVEWRTCRLRTSRAKSPGSNAGVTALHDPGPARVRGRHAHDALADRGHLRPRVRIDDRGDQVAAEGRPDLEEQVRVGPVLALDVVVADLQVGAVGGQAAAQGAGDARREVAAVGRAADQEDLRLAPARLGDRHAGVREGAVLGQLGMVGQQDAVGAVADDVPGQLLHVVPAQQAHHLVAQLDRPARGPCRSAPG